jgi:hypothetical protein
MIRVVRLQMNSIKRHTTLKQHIFHLYCTYVQDDKYTEKMVQGYRFQLDTPVIIRPKQQNQTAVSVRLGFAV